MGTLMCRGAVPVGDTGPEEFYKLVCVVRFTRRHAVSSRTRNDAQSRQIGSRYVRDFLDTGELLENTVFRV
jgi:hypothetical protein